MKTLAKTFVVAAATAVAVAVAAPPASATPVPIPGQSVMFVSDTCGMVVANDVTPTAQFGGPQVWTGVAFIDFAQAGGTTQHTITVSCDLYVNGNFQGTVIGPDTGVDAIVDARALAFTASLYDNVSLCANVTVDGVASPPSCDSVTSALIPPQEIGDAVDTAVCTALIVAAPYVDFVFGPGFVFIDPTSGDLFVLGNPVYDCF